MLDILYIENPRERKIKNFYLNDFNYYNKNLIKMRNQKLKILNRIRTEKIIERKRNPVPKMLYSTSGFHFNTEHDIKIIKDKLKENIEENIEKTKPIIDDMVNMINTFNIDFDSDDEENEKKDDNNIIKKNYTDGNFFITKTQEIKNDNFKEKEIIQNDLKNVKVIQSKNVMSQKKYDKIKQRQKLYKDNLIFSDFGKYKFTKTGLLYPKKLKKYELPNYNGKDKIEKEYFNYKKKIKNPNLVYNKLNSFDEEFNKDLGLISNNYGKVKSRVRFTKNPLLKQYMNMIPIYDIYKDIKSIENRYINSKYKYKLLPLVNNKLRSLDKLADKFYRMQQLNQGLNNLLKIQPRILKSN